ncbi:hypothetical protein SUDANB106_05084 [Streptomyces sp. enrichment culture]|uniref:hypothetical protein n=1 Tax=Streptomyces sp. enrichment culture TaxID=1795815 RepID=UPI003F54B68F
MVVGSTDDGHTFAVINYPLRAAHRILTHSGFTARHHQRRTLYLLPPGTPAEDAHDRTGTALSGLFTHTMDIVDLSSTTRWTSDGSPSQTATRFDLSNGRVTVTAHTQAAHGVLEQHGFARTSAGYTLPGGLGERESVGAVTRAETHLWALGLSTEITLGYPTPDAIPPAPGRTDASAPPQLPQAAKRRTR